jgi:hypothetical protein
MSRRCHHGSPRHARQLAREQLARDQRRGSIVADRPGADDRPTDDRPAPDDRSAPDDRHVRQDLSAGDAGARDESPAPQPSRSVELVDGERRHEPSAGPGGTAPMPAGAFQPHQAGPVEHRPAWAPATGRPPAISQPSAAPTEPRRSESEAPAADGIERGATAPQLRRFIKSRAYVPMHELRRRFAINGGEDDVTPIDVERQRIYVGLPPREGGLLGELLRAGDIGFELSLDPIAPIVVGVYPMRPVPRS